MFKNSIVLDVTIRRINGWHEVLIMSINLNGIAVLNISGADYRCIINGIWKSDAVSLQQNANLLEERGVLWK